MLFFHKRPNKLMTAALCTGVLLLGLSAASLFLNNPEDAVPVVSSADTTDIAPAVSDGQASVSDSQVIVSDSQVSVSDTQISAENEPEPEVVQPEYIADPAAASVEAVSFELYAPYIAVGHSYTAKLQLTPADTDPAVVYWMSSDESIATVDSSGCVTACAPGTVCITARAGEAQYLQWLTVLECKKIYFSPSTEKLASFAYGDTNEQAQMTVIAGHCIAHLEKCGFETYLASADINYIARASEASEVGADIYIALQANMENDQVGTVTYYHPSSGLSLNIAFRLYERLAPLSPTEDPDAVYNGSYLGYREIKYPYDEQGIPSVIIALEHPYSAAGTKWMVDSAQDIGYEIADALMESLAGF